MSPLGPLPPRPSANLLLIAPDDAQRRQHEEQLAADGFLVACAVDREAAAPLLAELSFDAVIERDLTGGIVTRAELLGPETTRQQGGRWSDDRAALRLSTHRALAASRQIRGLRARTDALGRQQSVADARSDEVWEKREALEQRAARNRKLAQLVAHDLKNHLSVIKTNVEYALYEAGPQAACRAPLDGAATAVESAFRLVTDYVSATGRAA